jgi:sugar phosphate isomerase/epimerase
MNRRDFLAFSSAALAASTVGPAAAGADIKQLGVQLFSVPKLLEKDFSHAIALLAGMRYSAVELYGPYSFSAPEAVARWRSVTPQLGFSGSGFFGLSVERVRAILTEHQMKVPSMHTDLQTLQTRMGELSEAAHSLGVTYVVLPSIPEENRKSLDDYRRMADTFNAIGEQARRRGVKFCYHNHGYGLQEIQGQIPLKVVLQRTDPALVFLEMDIYWTTAGGADPVEYLKEYPSRYKLLHLKDMKERRRFKGDGGDPSQWIELFPYMTSVGDGVIDVKAIVSQGHRAGVEHFIVEQDMVANPEIALRRSADYLFKL